MALDYHKCAQEISDIIGGGQNIVSAAHCATRLRLVTVDNSKVDKAKLENVDGVKGVFESNGQLQIIIGTGTVNKVYDEFLKITGVSEATKDEVKAAAAAKKPVWYRMIKALGDVFVPILPAIVASGLMMGLVEALGKAVPNFASTDWYGFLDLVSSTAFAYLPVIVAVSAARVFGGNIFLGAVIGLCMINSSLTNAWSLGSADTQVNYWYLLGHLKLGAWTVGSVRQVGYQGHVIPVIIAVWLMCQLEKWLHKHVPEMIDLFVTPLTTVLVTAFLTFTIIGPVFAQLESWVLVGAEWLVKNPIGAGVMGAVYPVTVVMGLHHMYNIIEASMLSSVGLNTWMPIASAANFAQFGACLAVGIKTHNRKTKAVAVPSSMSAALGITEPAIFGVNMRFMKPFVAGMIGGAVGSVFAAFSGIGATAYGVTGIPGYLTINNIPVYTILLLLSGGIAFAVTMAIWKEDAEVKAEEKEDAAEMAAADASLQNAGAPVSAASAQKEKTVDLPEVMSCSAGKASAPARGRVISYEDIPDPTFASGALGAGVGIEPEEGVVYAPCDGTISTVAETKHAIGISDGDLEYLIHVGVDTVKMNGDGFDVFVKEGDKVARGQKIMTFDRGKIKAAGYPDTVVFLLTNSDDYPDFKTNL